MIEIIKPGIYTTIQDIGRYGYRNMGIPISGAMDTYAFVLANQLVGNEQYTPAFEILMQGPHLKFTKSAYIAITGATIKVMLNNQEVPLNSRVYVPENSLLEFQNCTKGMYTYLSIAGGIDTKSILGSASFYAPVTGNQKLKKGDQFAFKTSEVESKNYSGVSVSPSFFEESKILAYPGPEWSQLEEITQKKILTSQFKVESSSNRMSINLSQNNDLSAKEIITAPVSPGTVQMTPSGNVSVLMRDAQTTGGYARILQLTEEGIRTIAQKRPNEMVTFEVIDAFISSQ